MTLCTGDIPRECGTQKVHHLNELKNQSLTCLGKHTIRSVVGVEYKVYRVMCLRMNAVSSYSSGSTESNWLCASCLGK